MIKIGGRIKDFRTSKRLSQQEFANLLDVSKGTISKIESDIQEPGSRILFSLKDVFNTNINWILSGEGDIYNTNECLAADGTNGKYLRLVRKQKSLSIPQLAKIIDLPIKDIEEIESEHKPLPNNIKDKIAKTFNISVDFYTCKDGSKHKITTYSKEKTYENIKYANIDNIELNTTNNYMSISDELIELIGCNAKSSFITKCHCEAMDPVIPLNSEILIDRSKKTIVDGKFYVAKIDENIAIRRLQKLIGNKIKLIAENKNFESEIINIDECNFQIIGQILWFSSKL